MNTEVTVRYTQGSWTGYLGTDVIAIQGVNGTYTINIATIFESENFFLTGVKWQGILGLAYSALAKVIDVQTIDYIFVLKVKAVEQGEHNETQSHKMG